jgi:dTMP kinase
MKAARGVLVVFEGLDGSGKSSAARETARALEAEELTTPSPSVRRFRDQLIRELGTSQEAHQLFYLATVFSASEQARALLERGRSVVLDRYFLSTQAYAAFRGTRLDLDALGAHPALIPADLTVLLEAPLEVRRARLAARGASAADRETLSPSAQERLLEEHERRAGLPVVGRLLRIDTSVWSPEGVADRVLEEVGRLTAAP